MRLLKKIASLFSEKKEEKKQKTEEQRELKSTFKKKPIKKVSQEEWRPGDGAPKKRTNDQQKIREGNSQTNKPRPPRKKKRPQQQKSSNKEKGAQPPKQAPKPAPKKEHPPWDPATFSVPPKEGKKRFHDLDLHPDLMRGIHTLGWQYCTPIQAEILPGTLKGQDMAGRAQTGTGKTAAFLISIINHCLTNKLPKQSTGNPRALIIAPTRELAMQIKRDADGLMEYTDLNTIVLYGGMDYNKQQRQLEDGKVDLVVATPGRLLDFESKNVIKLRFVEIMVIDEADRMLDMGFIPDVRRIIYKTPPKEKRQTVLFSATLTDEVMRLAAAWMVEPVRIDIEPEQVAVDTIDQKLFIITDDQKFTLLYNIIKTEQPERIIIFTNRRDQSERLVEELRRFSIRCEMLSGAVTQKKRMRILEEFREGKIRTLVATDVAGRGIHVDGVSHVVNFNIPENPDDYVHRIGRTGRAGSLGTSITFACEMESFELPAIEKLLGITLKCAMPSEELLKDLPPAPPRKKRPPRRVEGRHGGNNRHGGKKPHNSGQHQHRRTGEKRAASNNKRSTNHHAVKPVSGEQSK